MAYTPIKYPAPCLSSTEGELLRLDYVDMITDAGGTQVAKVLNFSAYIAFIIPAALEADYNAANQAKKEVMARIYFEVSTNPTTDFDTQYTARYNELYP
jgi:hypothetical protein